MLESTKTFPDRFAGLTQFEIKMIAANSPGLLS